MPKWESFWDYQNRKPKNFLQTQRLLYINRQKKPKSPKMQALWLCNATPKSKFPVKSRSDIHELATGESFVGRESFVGDDDFKELTKSKNSLLSSIWRKGIPKWLKKTVWPITIGNKLEVKII